MSEVNNDFDEENKPKSGESGGKKNISKIIPVICCIEGDIQ